MTFNLCTIINTVFNKKWLSNEELCFFWGFSFSLIYVDSRLEMQWFYLALLAQLIGICYTTIILHKPMVKWIPAYIITTSLAVSVWVVYNYTGSLIFTVVYIGLISVYYNAALKKILCTNLYGFIFSGLLVFSLILWYNLNIPDINQFYMEIPLISAYGIYFTINIDGISLVFVLLTTFIIFLCFLSAFQVEKNYKEFIFYLLLIEIFLILSFVVYEIFCFYIFFESVLIPMFLIIGKWGARPRKIRAAYYFFLYTLCGSLLMLVGILYIQSIFGTTELSTLNCCLFSFKQQLVLWVCFFIPFAVKIPMFPFHIWLPEAHVEAPTIGSIILASLLLKLGSYGFLRFTLPLFPLASQFYSPLVYTLGVISVVYASLVTIRQIDLKRIIAYSSIAHMNLIVLGLFSYTQQGLDGSIYLMIGHGIVSSALFFCVGVLYDRYHTRLVEYYGGLAAVMPRFACYFFIFTLANMGFPGTSNFIGELLILVGIFEKNTTIMFFAASGIVFSAIYSIWVYNRIIFGALKIKYIAENLYSDISIKENLILMFLTTQMFILGIHSTFISELTSFPVALILRSVTWG